MGYSFTPDDVAFLRSDAGSAALATVSALELTPAALMRELGPVRARWADRAAALVETVLLRRRAAGKVPEHWLLTDDALQQATAAPVARRRAARILSCGGGTPVHDVTCSVGTEVAAFRDLGAMVIGSDLDPVRLAMAAANVPGALFLRADALVPTSAAGVVVADPARRDARGRRMDFTAVQPPLPALIDTYRHREWAIKCAPGLDVSALARAVAPIEIGELELASLDGSVREAVLYSPGLAAAHGLRRAVVMRGDAVFEELTSADPDEVDAAAPGRYLFDPDGAVVRAGLVRQYAAKHGLWQLDPQLAYLTGDRIPDGTRGFEILDVGPVHQKWLRRRLAELDCGSLEILERGLKLDPDALRRSLRLRGSRALTLVLARIGQGGQERKVAYVCAATTT